MKFDRRISRRSFLAAAGVSAAALALTACGGSSSTAASTAGSAAASSAAGGKSTDYPTKGISVICPWSAGGGTDSCLRAFCEAMGKNLGVTLTVDNQTGGGGILSVENVQSRNAVVTNDSCQMSPVAEQPGCLSSGIRTGKYYRKQ